jgi:peptidoglycan L-alanyl-D-glutamate endopeptidase CwlK
MSALHGRSNDLALLHPKFRIALIALLADLQKEKIPFELFEGARSPFRQADLYAKGRTTPGPSVTRAQPWESYHQFGLGGDLVLKLATGWSWDTTTPTLKGYWSRMQALAKKHGLETLSFELPHVQLAGLNIHDLQEGKYPEGGDEAWAANLSKEIDSWSFRPYPPPYPVLAVAAAAAPQPANEQETKDA